MAATGLTKRFGGLAAVSDVSLDLWRGRIHAVIGPNGAGKSTLTNLLSGDLPPSAGRIVLGGHDITRSTPEKVSRRGLGRSYQKTNIFLPFTVWDNVRLAAQSRAPQAWRWLRNATTFEAINGQTARAIELSGLKERQRAVAGTISHGEQRQLEIAMALATAPQVLLLDEPTTNLDAEGIALYLHLIEKHSQGKLVIISSNDVDEYKFCEEVISISDYK